MSGNMFNFPAVSSLPTSFGHVWEEIEEFGLDVASDKIIVPVET
jgi:hypothetical protein